MNFAPVANIDDWCPPAPRPRTRPLGPIALLRTIYNNPLEAWTQAHFEEPLVVMRLMGVQAVVVNEPSAIRHVLLDNANNYHKDWLQRRVLSNGLEGGLLTAESEQWRMQRRALSPVFARKTVRSFAPAMMAAAEELITQWQGREGGTVDVAADVTRLTLEVLRRTIFSEGLGGDPEEFRIVMTDFFNAIGRIDALDVLRLPNFLPRTGRRQARPALRFFDAAMDKIIATRRRHLCEDPASVPKDILTLLLQAKDPDTGRGMSETEIRANIVTFISAGHETTANTLSWSLYLLSQSPTWRERVAAEAKREWQGPIDTLADRLVETRAVIDEAVRLYPPIAAMSRAAIGPDKLCGITIKRGAIVAIAPYVLHRHRALWDRPDVFDPTRFLNGARERIDRYGYLPFGAGPRICIGATFALQEATLVLASIIRSVTLELASGHKVRPILRVTLRPHGGLPMIVRRRIADIHTDRAQAGAWQPEVAQSREA
jgi:cytochrome P450